MHTERTVAHNFPGNQGYFRPWFLIMPAMLFASIIVDTLGDIVGEHLTS